MQIITDARRVALRSYSMWANYLGILALILPEVIYAVWQRDTDPRLWWFSGLALILFGTIGRLIEQPRRRSWIRILLLAAAVVALLFVWIKPAVSAPVSEAAFAQEAVPLVGKWEGKRNKAYLDSIASPPVWTVCYGETRGVQRGDYYTDAQCADMLGEGLLQFRVGLHKAFTATTMNHRLTPKRDAAYVSLAYNAGVYAISRSTAVRRLNAGDIAGGCTSLTWWNKAGARVIRGLVNRRADEYQMCMEGLA